MWEPLAAMDYVLLGLASLHQALVLATVVHLIACRDWPPYVVKNVPLVCVTGVAGAIHMLGVVLAFGFFKHTSSSLLSNCFLHGVVGLTGAGLYYAGAVVRVYRNYKVLVLHEAHMMPAMTQILVVQAPMWAMAFCLLSPSVAKFDFELNRCRGQARFVILAAHNYAGLLMVGAVYLLWKMKNARRQMNEFRVMMLSLGTLLVSLVILDASSGRLSSSGDATLFRRIALLNNLVRGALLFWPVIFTPLCKYIQRDQGYADSFTMGPPTITSAVLRASLADQLKVDELWALFEKFAEERLPPAVPAFYKAVMDRDKEEGYFERQAKTMDIIDTYIADNAIGRADLKLSEACRRRILTSEVTRYTIFAEAAAEVLEVLQERCEMAFQASPAFEVLLRQAEKDEAEIEALGKAKLVPRSQRSVGFDRDSEYRGGGRSRFSRFERWTNSTAAASSFGTRSEVASQQMGADIGSPLEWPGEKDIEIEGGEPFSDEGFNTGALSALSIAANTPGGKSISDSFSSSSCGSSGSGTRFDSRHSLRGTIAATPLSDRHLSSRSGEGQPAVAAAALPSRVLMSPAFAMTPPSRRRPWRPPGHHQKQQRMPPPAPWAPWRRQTPDPAIAPASSSPATTTGMMTTSLEEGRGGGPRIATRALSSAGTSLGSLVMLVPPAHSSEGGRGSGVGGHSVGSGGVETAGASSSGKAAAGEFVPVAPWRNWVNATFILEEEEEEEEEEKKEEEPFVETHADFVAKTQCHPPTRGYRPKNTWLEIAIQKEEAEKAAERVRAAAPTAAHLKGALPPRVGAAGKGRTSESAVPGSNDAASDSATAALGTGLSTLPRRESSPPPPHRPVPLCLSSSTHSAVSFPPASPAWAHTPQESPALSPLREGGRCSPPPVPLSRSPPRVRLSPLPRPPAVSATALTLPRAVERLLSPQAGSRLPASRIGGESPVAVSSKAETASPSAGVEMPLHPSVPAMKAVRTTEGLLGSPAADEDPINPLTAPHHEGEVAASESSSTNNEPIAVQRSDTAALLVPAASMTVAAGSFGGGGGGGFEDRRQMPSPARPAAAADAAPPDDLSLFPPGELEEADRTPKRVRSPLLTPPPADRPARKRKTPAAREGSARKTRQPRGRAPRRPVTATPEAASDWMTQSGEGKQQSMEVSAVSTKRPARAQPARAPAWAEISPPPLPTPTIANPAEETISQQATSFVGAVGADVVPLAPPAAPPAAAPPPFSPSPSASPLPLSGPAWPTSFPSAAAAAGDAPLSMSPSPPPRTPPRPVLCLTTMGALPGRAVYTPPSPAGRSSSGSPSCKSSPHAVGPPLLPPAAAPAAAGAGLTSRDLPASLHGGNVAGVPLAWSLSDSTLSACSRSTSMGGGAGCGGGASSVSASASASATGSDTCSPLVGMRFVAAGAEGGGGAGGSAERPRSWAGHKHNNVRGSLARRVRESLPVPLHDLGGRGGGAGLRVPMPMSVALSGVGRSMRAEPAPEPKPATAAADASDASVACREPPATLPGPKGASATTAQAITAATAAAAAAAAAAVGEEASLEGRVGGRQGKRPRRFFP